MGEQAEQEREEGKMGQEGAGGGVCGRLTGRRRCEGGGGG